MKITELEQRYAKLMRAHHRAGPITAKADVRTRPMHENQERALAMFQHFAGRELTIGDVATHLGIDRDSAKAAVRGLVERKRIACTSHICEMGVYRLRT